MDDLSQELERLFDQADKYSASESELDECMPGEGIHGFIRCKCGSLVNISMPRKCEGCGDMKSYWKTGNGKVIKISEMSLSHLTASIRFLAEKMEKYPASQREAFEIALDYLYAELGSREKETKQLTGIQAALFRSLNA